MLHYANYNPSNRSAYSNAPVNYTHNFVSLKTRALANLDPFRPRVDLPLFLFEMKDLPEMLQQLGNVLRKKIGPRDVPKGYLAFQFGWKPLVSDVFSLFNLAKSIDDQMRYMRNLEAGSRIHRTLSDGEISTSVVTDGYTLTGPLSGFAVKADVTTRVTAKVWYTANGKLLTVLPNSNLALRDLSRDIVLGLTWRPWSVWDYIPWSWLIDWFYGISAYLQALQGMVSFRTTRMCVMAHTTSKSELTRVRTASGLDASSSVLVTEQKERSVYINPIPSPAFMPFLTDGHMAILGALLTSAGLKGI